MDMNHRFIERHALVQATAIGALAAVVGDGLYVSMKNYRRCTIILDVTNPGAGITAGVVTLKQAKTVAGGSEKALAFSLMHANLDCAAGQAPASFVETAVAANTFSTDATVSKRLRYVLEVDAEDLDIANDFDCVRMDVANMVAAVGQVGYVLWGGRYGASADATID